MAKKGQPVQLQAEINNDEEWERLLQKDGLIFDIYSEWCGPCSGMAGNLKKIKLEIGGDLLQLAIAKADEITVLQRFKNNCEPTWMFVAGGKMCNLMFGANLPKLTTLIIDELKKEKNFRAGIGDRVQMEITDLSAEEKERAEVLAMKEMAARLKEEEKRAKELRERRLLECHNILEHNVNTGVIIVFPHARSKYNEVLRDALREVDLNIGNAEKVSFTEEEIEQLYYFANEPFFDDEIIEDMREKATGPNHAIAVVIRLKKTAVELETTIEDVLCGVVYGPMKQPPGSPDSPAERLSAAVTEPPVLEEEEEEEGEVEEEVPSAQSLVGIWTPSAPEVKAVCLKLFFTKSVEQYLVPEPEPEPPHYAFIFDVLKRNEVAKVMDQYQTDIMHYGFFTSPDPEDTEVVSKNFYRYEKNLNKTFREHLVIQLSRKRSTCVLAFAQLGPTYMSPNANEGKEECKLFFPEDYDEIEGEVDDMENNFIIEFNEPVVESVYGEEDETEYEFDDYLAGGEGTSYDEREFEGIDETSTVIGLISEPAETIPDTPTTEATETSAITTTPATTESAGASEATDASGFTAATTTPDTSEDEG